MFRSDLTAGERGLVGAYLLMGVASTVAAIAVAAHLTGGSLSLGAPSPYLAWFVVSGGVAGPAALRIVRDRIGRPGPRGIISTAAAAIVSVFFAGLVGGTLALPVYGTMFGPFSLAVTFVATPGLALAWIGCFVLAHLRIQRWQAERDSIFAYQPRT